MDEKGTSFNKYTGPGKKKKKPRRNRKPGKVLYAPVRLMTAKEYERERNEQLPH